MPKNKRYINREISWLAFNARVLQESQDPSVPLLDRLKFLGIFSNNLDEFYRVRIATLKRIMKYGSRVKSTLHQKPTELLDEIQSLVIEQNRVFESSYKTIRTELATHGVHIIDELALNDIQKVFVREFFAEQIRPALVPIMLGQVHTFPTLSDSAIYLAVRLSESERKAETQYALVQVPVPPLGRFVILPSSQKEKVIILLEDIIRYNLPELFAMFGYRRCEAYTIKITRDQELDIDSDLSQSLMEKISQSVRNRQKGTPVRFVYDKDMPRDLLDMLRNRLKLHKYDNMIPAGRYHNFKDFISFPDLGLKHLRTPRLKPALHPMFQAEKSTFDAIRKHDILLHYPYQSFSHQIDLLREAAIDPHVRSIRMTLYRVAKRSHVINALVNAARNGKHVVVVVELQARFDEEANIHWARELSDAGIHVIYGVPQLKVHAKLVLIERIENSKKQLYATVGTGNFNEGTAALYSDHSLFTADKRITHEVKSVFEFLERNFLVKNYKHLILSPNRTRNKIIKLIDAEIKSAKAGRTSGIVMKLNSLVDENIIDWLYKASTAGVPICLIVRGMCGLIPGVRNMSENIEVISIIDRFLEHSRIYRFENAGKPLFYISSADMMTRNLDQRIEVSCPIYDPRLQEELQMVLDVQRSDTVKARRWNSAVVEVKNKKGSKAVPAVRAQYALVDRLALLSQKYTSILETQRDDKSSDVLQAK